MAYGKIARLPRSLREQLNRRAAEGEPGSELVNWLNGLPAVQAVLKKHFFGREISAQNFSDWKQHGHQAWLVQQELVACTSDLAEDVEEIEAAHGDAPLTEQLAVMLGARYAKLLSGWNGEVDEGFLKRVQGLGRLCQQIVALRRSEHSAGRLRVSEERLEEAQKSERLKALEACVDEAERWPDVIAAFKTAFSLLRDRGQAERAKAASGNGGGSR